MSKKKFKLESQEKGNLISDAILDLQNQLAIIHIDDY